MANIASTTLPLLEKERRKLVVPLAQRHPDWPHVKIADLLHLAKDTVDKILQAERVRAGLGPARHNFMLPDATWLAVGKAPREH